jgi:hypothetical protein
MAAISYIFTLERVADLLNEDPDGLDEICMEMTQEDGLIQIYRKNDEYTRGFTAHGIEILQGLIEERKHK